MSPAWPTDPINGDHFTGAGYGAAAVARYRTDQVNARHKAEVSAARSAGLSTTQGSGGGPR